MIRYEDPVVSFSTRRDIDHGARQNPTGIASPRTSIIGSATSHIVLRVRRVGHAVGVGWT